MKRTIDLATWSRREYYEFFGRMDNPYTGVVAEVDVTLLYQHSKQAGDSFYLRYLHALMRAVNEVEELRCRIEQGQVVCHDRIHVEPTQARPDGSFGFNYFPYDPSFKQFAADAQADMAYVAAGSGLMLRKENMESTDVVYFTVLPWVSFSALAHPRCWGDNRGIVSMAVGKFHKVGERLMMPVQLQCHHGLADGYHMGRFYELAQQYFDEPF